jgi:hypothetical protein
VYAICSGGAAFDVGASVMVVIVALRPRLRVAGAPVVVTLVVEPPAASVASPVVAGAVCCFGCLLRYWRFARGGAGCGAAGGWAATLDAGTVLMIEVVAGGAAMTS